MVWKSFEKEWKVLMFKLEADILQQRETLWATWVHSPRVIPQTVFARLAMTRTVKMSRVYSANIQTYIQYNIIFLLLNPATFCCHDFSPHYILLTVCHWSGLCLYSSATNGQWPVSEYPPEHHPALPYQLSCWVWGVFVECLGTLHLWELPGPVSQKRYDLK